MIVFRCAMFATGAAVAGAFAGWQIGRAFLRAELAEQLLDLSLTPGSGVRLSDIEHILDALLGLHGGDKA